MAWLEALCDGRTDRINHFDAFQEYVKDPLSRHAGSITPDPLFWGYIGWIDSQYPDGYLVLADHYFENSFVLGIKHAKAVVIYTGKEPAGLLNHNVLRVIYRSPVVAISNREDELFKFKTRGEVEFSCDGADYSISS